jgi:hypothetical protein
MAVLQNCVDFVESETGCCSATCDADGTEVSVKVEETVDVEDETLEAISFPKIKTENEVRLCGVCEVVTTDALRPFIAPTRKL